MLTQFQSLRAIINPFVQICLLRQGPQDLPTSGILLAIALTAHTVVSILLSSISLNALNAIFWGVLNTVLLVVLTVTILYVQRRFARVIQTVTALAGTETVFAVIALPILGPLYGADKAAGEGVFAALLVIILTLWSVVVVGHILRHALSTPYFFGLVLALVFYFISDSVFKALFSVGA